jgi:excisionase family DNA binding protein
MAQLTVSQASQMWGVSRRTIQKWIDEGRVPAKKLDQLHRERGLPEVGIDAWVILTDKRPAPSLTKIDRPKKAETEAEAGGDAPSMPLGFWR